MSAQLQYPTLPVIAGTDYVHEPIQAFKAAVAQIVADAWEEDVSKIYAGVDTGKKGTDLALAVPRFKKGKPDEWIKKVEEAVR